MVFKGLLSGSDGKIAREDLIATPSCPLSQAARQVENQQRQVWSLQRPVDGLLICSGGDSKSPPGSMWALACGAVKDSHWLSLTLA